MNVLRQRYNVKETRKTNSGCRRCGCGCPEIKIRIKIRIKKMTRETKFEMNGKRNNEKIKRQTINGKRDKENERDTKWKNIRRETKRQRKRD